MAAKMMKNASTQNSFLNERPSPISADALKLIPRHLYLGQTRDSPTCCGSNVKPVTGVAANKELGGVSENSFAGRCAY